MKTQKTIVWPQIPMNNSNEEIQRFSLDLIKALEANLRNLYFDLWNIEIPVDRYNDKPNRGELYFDTAQGKLMIWDSENETWASFSKDV